LSHRVDFRFAGSRCMVRWRVLVRQA